MERSFLSGVGYWFGIVVYMGAHNSLAIPGHAICGHMGLTRFDEIKEHFGVSTLINHTSLSLPERIRHVFKIVACGTARPNSVGFLSSRRFRSKIATGTSTLTEIDDAKGSYSN